MNASAKKAAIPAIVTSIVASIVFGTPEVIIELILFTGCFVLTLAVLVCFLRLSPGAGFASWKQKLVIWFVATLTSTLACGTLLLMSVWEKTHSA